LNVPRIGVTTFRMRSRLRTAELPKNGKIRRVDLSLVLAETLQRLRVQRAQEALARDWKQLPDWVFCNEEGRHIWESNFERRVFHKALDRAKFRRLRFHDLRHTFASRLIQNGESLGLREGPTGPPLDCDGGRLRPPGARGEQGRRGPA
jgi:site-specific recombinase XerD